VSNPASRKTWIKQRNASLQKMVFPFAPYRPGQRDMMSHIYVSIRDHKQAMIQAPTGIGKTMGSLFPALKAMGEGHCEKVFFLTARTTGKEIASGAMDILIEQGAKLSYVEITSKEKICFRKDAIKECDGCPWNQDYEQKIRPALKAAAPALRLNRAEVEKAALEHEVCPFELSLDLSLLTDVVICDYNYAFDPRVYLQRFFDEEEGEYVFLVDEAHNLVDRGRSMFSAELSRDTLMEIRRSIKDTCKKEAGLLQRLIGFMKTFYDEHPQTETIEVESVENPEGDSNPDSDGDPEGDSGATTLVQIQKITLQKHDQCLVLDGIPPEISEMASRCWQAAGEWLEDTLNEGLRKEMSDLYYGLDTFLEISRRFGPQYKLIINREESDYQWQLFCLDPSRSLRKAFRKSVSSIFFSATLSPPKYFQEVLGISEDAVQTGIPSPFPPEHLQVMILPVDTIYRRRAETIHEVLSAIANMCKVPGNYMVFFPGYKYMNDAYDLFSREYPEVEAFAQEAGMSEEERIDFLDIFRNSPAPELQIPAKKEKESSWQSTESAVKSKLGFAVLGGAFGEGIDLVGDKLIGVAVVGVGMPGICVERDEIKRYYGDNHLGFRYAYTIPGMVKVLQAAGRVIRSPADKGCVMLIDSRFMRDEYQRLLADSPLKR